MKALILAENAPAARELCAGARRFADEVVVLTIGDMAVPDNCSDEIVHIAIPQGAVYDDVYPSVIAVFDNATPSLVFAESTRRMKLIIGRLAAHVHTSVITSVFSFEDHSAKSLYFGGIAERLQKPSTEPAFFTINRGVFEDDEASGDNKMKEQSWIAPKTPLELINSQVRERSGKDLRKADVVLAVGRGFSDKADLPLAKNLCQKLEAGLACSRPLTEGPNPLAHELYVGVSGLTLTPKVYIACGISGQMQHMVGCNRAGKIFAINKDKNAQIFFQCDYGLVGDAKKLLPALIDAL